jgi:prepilin-type N-terminal cleavage/methylation domain-containing protein
MIKFTKRSRRAFSLVEILFAVIIIGVLTAVAVPSLFNNKGKADDSNAKQTLRAAYSLISTSLDDSGALQGSTPIDLVAFLGTVDKNLSFAPTTAVNKGNVRTIGLDVSGDIVKIVAFGGKTATGINCFGITYDITGANATIFTRDSTSATCDTSKAKTTPTSGTNVSSIVGDFPLK